MTRPIKFRVWDKCHKEYLGDDDFVIDSHGNAGTVLGYEYDEYKYLFRMNADQEDFVVEQFTGLTDENSKEIYEGDIVKIPNDNSLEAVRYEHGMFIPVCFRTISIVEIVGNIHENANLLEGQK